QAKRLMWNYFALSPEERKARAASLVNLDDGQYDPDLGLSYPEIGGRARSLNRSQGAGTREVRGSVIQSFTLTDGAPATHDLFDDVTLDWSRVPGAAPLAALLADAERTFDPAKPWAILPTLARAHAAIAALPASALVDAKRHELEDVMRSCAGLWLEGIADTPTACPGDTLHVTFAAINRSPAPLALERLEAPLGARAYYAAGGASAFGPAPKPDPGAPADGAARTLAENQPVVAVASIALPASQPFTQPYWLVKRPSAGSFEVDDQSLIGTAENAPALSATARITIAGEAIAFDVPVVYRWTDRVLGDRYRALEVLPPVTCQFDRGVVLVNDAKPHELRLAVTSTRGAVSGTAKLDLPAGWRADPAGVAIRLAPGAEQVVVFHVTAGPDAATATISGGVEIAGRRYASSLTRIDYPHVPIQTMLSPCETRLVRTDLAVRGHQIAYVMGAGDQVPDALREMGFHVTLLTDDDVENGDLSRFDCIVTGIRAFNTRPRLRVLEPRVLDYVRAGGRLVVQYCTDDDALKDRLGPWPLTVSRDRVAVETAEMRFLQPAHPLLRSPNAIGVHDFDGWVQERGLNYANPFDPRYQAVLSANDPGEPARDGGLLYTRCGKGVFVYTGLAFFRQLPAGVPGAWRLFANLVSAEH
ncbi:MAG TPA: hypothetical protein VMH61_03440, partial [Candidatus Acidoferrales bacterium]|nr:hypothetical protein [Candidatus Acidoferrales bacterium]